VCVSIVNRVTSRSNEGAPDNTEPEFHIEQTQPQV